MSKRVRPAGAELVRSVYQDAPSWLPDGIAKSHASDPLFTELSWGFQNELYPYQHPLAGRSGPWVRLDDRDLLMLSSYDYLGLVGHPVIEEAAHEALRQFGTSTGGVRLLTGTSALHLALDETIAQFKQTDAAVSFSSTYLANLAVLTALFGPSDVVLLDRLAHRSIVDACRLAGVRVRTFEHSDVDSLRRQLKKSEPGQRTLVIVEGVYSMDGDRCPLAEVVQAAKEHDAFLMVDEAHSFGVVGESGRGIDEASGVDPADVDIWVGALSKAIPSNGGFVAGSRELVLYLQHRAPPFIFSSALNPAAVAAAKAAIEVLQAEPQRLRRAHENAEQLRAGLTELGYDTGASSTPIVPLIVGDDQATYLMAHALYERGIIANPIVFPAVAAGTSRLRLCATAAHGSEDITHALDIFKDIQSASPPDTTT